MFSCVCIFVCVCEWGSCLEGCVVGLVVVVVVVLVVSVLAYVGPGDHGIDCSMDG